MNSPVVSKDKAVSPSFGIIRSFEIAQPSLKEHATAVLRTASDSPNGSSVTHQYEYKAHSLTVLSRVASQGNSSSITMSRGDNALDFNEFMEDFDAGIEFKGKAAIRTLITRMFNDHSKTCVMSYTPFQKTDFVMAIYDAQRRARLDITVAIVY